MTHVDVVHVGMGFPIGLHSSIPQGGKAETAADANLAHAHIHSASSSWHGRPSAAWTADGRHIVMASPPAPAYAWPAALDAPPDGQELVVGFGDESFSHTLVVKKVCTSLEVPACTAVSLVDHGLGSVAPAGDIMLWGDLPLGADRRHCSEEIVAYSLPDLQRLYTVQVPSNALNAHYQGDQKSIQEIVWGPDSGLFAIRWAFGDARQQLFWPHQYHPRRHQSFWLQHSPGKQWCMPRQP